MWTMNMCSPSPLVQNYRILLEQSVAACMPLLTQLVHSDRKWQQFSSTALLLSVVQILTRSSAIAEGPRDVSHQLKFCHFPRNSAETTRTTSPEEIEVMKLEGYSGPMCNKHVQSTMTRLSRFHCPTGVINKPTMIELWISPVYRRLAVAKFSKSTM